MKDFNNKDWKDRIEDIKNNLYLGGGTGQCNALLSIMMSPYGSNKKDFGVSDIESADVLAIISQQLSDLKKTIKNGGIFPISFIENTFKDYMRKGMAYACLDNNLKFCVKHYGEDDWKDIKYVFPYMNCSTAYDVSFGYDHIHQS